MDLKIRVLYWYCGFGVSVNFKKYFIYLSMRDTEGERDRDIGRGRSLLPARSPMPDLIQSPGIMLQVEGRLPIAEPLRDPKL